MMMVIAALPDLALRIGRVLDGPRRYVATMGRLRDALCGERSCVLLLDVQLGGQTGRAVEFIPEALQIVPGMQVIVITRTPTAAELREMVSLGAYAFVDRLDDGFVIHLHERVMAARASGRKQGRPPSRAVH